VIHFARVAGAVVAQPSGEAGEIVARVWLGECPAAAAGAIVRTAAGWHYAAPLLAGVADVSAAPSLRSTQSRADLECQIVRFYRGEAAAAGGPWAVAS
jgi:hypothetical protein